MKHIYILTATLFFITIHPSVYAQCKCDGMPCDCADAPHCFCDNPLNFCGYRVIYNPYTNCTKVEAGDCDRECHKGHHCMGNNCGKLTNIPVGSPVMLEISGLNPLKYGFGVGARQAITGQLDFGASFMHLYSSSFTGILPNEGIKSAGGGSPPPPNTDTTEPCKTCEAQFNATWNSRLVNAFTLRDKGQLDTLGIDLNEKLSHCADCQSDVANQQRGFLAVIPLLEQLNQDITAYNDILSHIHADVANFIERYNALADRDNGCHIADSLRILREWRSTIMSQITNATPAANNILNILAMIGNQNISADLLRVASGVKTQWQGVIGANDTELKDLNKNLDSTRLNLQPYVRYLIPKVEKDADYINFYVNATPRNAGVSSDTIINVNEGYVAGYKTGNIISVPTCGGVHFAFGTGPVLTGFSNPTYDLVPDSITGTDPNGNSTVLYNGNRLHRTSDSTQPNTVNIGVSAQLFISYRSCNYWYFGGTLGVAYASDKNASLLLGGSIMYGKKVKVALSTGLAMSTVRTPLGEYSIGGKKDSESIQFYDKDYSDDLSKNKISFRPNWFISLTVNFGSFTH